MATKILRKLTIKEVVGGKAEILKIAQTGKEKPDSTTGAPVDLLTIIGQVNSYQPGEGDNGSFVKLKGAFEATNLDSGEVIPVNGNAILPNFVADQIASALMDGAGSVDFAVKLTVSYDETAATMYKFGAESLLPVQSAEPVNALKAQLAGLGVSLPAPRKTPALPAPDAPSAPAPAPAPTAEAKPNAKKK